MIHRRTVLKGAAVSLVAAGAGPIAFFSGPVHAAGPAYSRATFEALVDQRFYVDDGAHPTLVLAEITDGPVAAGLEQFTLIFRGDPDAGLEEAIHRLTPEGGAFMDLHLSPAGSDADGSYYAAAFALNVLSAPGCSGASIG